MLSFNIKMTIDEDTVKCLFQLYKYAQGTERLTKGGFNSYIRSQLEQFGTGNGLLGEMFEYEELSYDDLKQLIEWGFV